VCRFKSCPGYHPQNSVSRIPLTVFGIRDRIQNPINLTTLKSQTFGFLSLCEASANFSDMKFLILVSVSFLCACASTALLKADPSLVQNWSEKLQASTPIRSPFIEFYQNGKFRLIYLAAHHEVTEESKTFQLIHALFEKKQFKIVILEGFPKSYGVSPLRMLEHAKSKGVSEGALAIRLAEKKQVAFLGGEPPEVSVAQAVLKAGYTPQDLLGFYFVRQLPTLKWEKALRGGNIEGVYSQFMSWQKTAAGFDKSLLFDFSAFKVWYKKTNHKDFDLSSFDDDEPAPNEHGHYLTQRISSVVGRVRDAFIVETITEELNEYGEVLVIYGASHLETQRPALFQMLGPPKWRSQTQII
jgi:hypothetical protein